MIRPQPTRWFELLVARDDTTLALEALARTGAVELETRAEAAQATGFADLRPLLAQFHELASRYRAWWPLRHGPASAVPEPPADTLARGLARLRAWAAEAEAPIRACQAAEAEAAQLVRWQAVVQQLADGPLDLGLAASAGPQLAVRLFCGPAGALACATTPLAGAEAALQPLIRPVTLPDGPGLLAMGTPAALEPLVRQVLAQKGEVLRPPAGLDFDAGAVAGQDSRPVAEPGHLAQPAQHAHLALLASRLADGQRSHAAAQAVLQRLAKAHGLPTVLADIERLQWVVDNVPALEAGPLLCWITGWTSIADPQRLEQAIEASGARALFRFTAPPAAKLAPLQLHNPPWARPFEVFSRAMGMPASDEADPSVLLALAVPLMFGYMFGDVGQGLVIAAVGWVLRGRFAMARLFIAGGLSAAAFGLLFGSVFSVHALHPLWIAPLDDPLAVLAAPLAGGALLLTLGLGLSALGARWRGTLSQWLATDGGLLAAWWGLMLSPWWPGGLPLAIAGALLFCAGHAWQARRASAALGAVGELVERLLQLLINTLSFARVGAFALAHAGLSSAIVALAQAAGHPVGVALVLVIGNAVVLLLEGLVVSIQTTRLVLFEFFARFLQGTGRVFRPLPLPPSAIQET